MPMNDNDKQPENNPWMKSLMVWVAILVGLALFVTLIETGTQSSAASNTLAYSQFLGKVEEGSVREVNVAGDVVTGVLTNGDKFRTYAPQDPQLTDRLLRKNVTITARPEEGPSIWQYILVQSLPFSLR